MTTPFKNINVHVTMTVKLLDLLLLDCDPWLASLCDPGAGHEDSLRGRNGLSLNSLLEAQACRISNRLSLAMVSS